MAEKNRQSEPSSGDILRELSKRFDALKASARTPQEWLALDAQQREAERLLFAETLNAVFGSD
jgi:chromosome segregation ATPase